MRRRGLAGELVLDGITNGGRPRGGFAGAVDGMRLHAESAVAAGLHREEARLLRGMVLGEDEQIQERVRDDFRASGLAHLLAVSGQNVMLLAALAAPFLGLAGLSPKARAAVLLGLIGLYVPLAGAGPSLQRAGIMGAAGIVALTASRPASRSYALLLAAAGTLALNPRVAGDPGWQLSFAAVVGILVLAPPLREALGHGPRPLAEGLAITLAATLFTAPLLAHHFGSVPLASLPANLLALPAVAPAMWLGMLKIALGQVAAAGGPLGPLADTVAGGVGRVADPLVGYIGWLAERFGSAPGAALRLPLGRAWAVVVAYAVLALLAAVLVRVAHRAEPRTAAAAAFWRRLPRRRRLLMVVLVVAAGAGLGARALRPPGPPGSLTVSFLDVGQGDATLIQDGHGAAVLFDGGPPEAAVTRLLRRAGVSRLAVVVATHQSRDHHGGLRDVIERYPVDLLLDGGDGTHDPTFRAVEAAAAERHVRRVQAVAPLRIRAGRLSIQVLSPRPRPPGPPPEDPNPRAVVAVVTDGWFDLLLSADAESDALAPLDLPDVDAMKIPHHGSADPGLPKVLERLRPEMAAAEVGKDNPYGHPARSTLAALRRARVPTYRTDRDGTVRLTVQGGGMRVSTER
jgi:competence protein ComEC